MKKCVITLDVGGTTIKAGIIDEKLDLLNETITSYSSESKKNADEIVSNILGIVYNQWDRIKNDDFIVCGIGLGFPGPFDYSKGISYMQGISKFDSIYGVDIASLIEKKIYHEGKIQLSEPFQILFKNDAAVFALGEYYKGEGMGYKKVMGLTLGTGCGTTFLDNGKIVRGKYGIPDSGWIFNEPFKKGIVDDYISKRGILKLAMNAGFNTRNMDVKDLSLLAYQGDLKAMKVFEQFGKLLGEVVNQYAKEFQPDVLVIGGKISKAFPLFNKGMALNVSNGKCEVRVSKNLSKSSLIGSASFFEVGCPKLVI